MDEKKGLVLFGVGCFALLVATFTYITLPEARSCKMTYDNGDILEGDCTILKGFHEERLGTKLMNIEEWKPFLCANYSVHEDYECPPCPVTTCPPCVCPKQKQCLLIDCPDSPPCPSFTCPKCKECEECFECPVCLGNNQYMQLKNLHPDGSTSVPYQGGFMHCRRRMLEIINK